MHLHCRYTECVDTESKREREDLLDELLDMQKQMETALVAEIVEPMLSMKLTTQQLKVLAVLTTSKDGATARELANTLLVSLATMSGIVDRLEVHDMVERRPDAKDLRVRRVLPSALGRETMQNLVAARPQLTRRPLEQLELDDLRALSRGLTALMSVMNDAHEETADES